jgi:AraC-like DNA-binding protein
VKVARHVPAAALRPYVTRAVEGWEHVADSASQLREVPIPGVPIIFNLGAPWVIESAGRSEQYDSFTGGLGTMPVLVRGGASWTCIELRLTPLGARRLFGRPMDELSNRTVTLEDVMPETREVVERLREAPAWPERFELVDDFLLRRLSGSVEPCREIAALADELGWSHRRLIARFRDQIGLPPKLLARVIRFNRVVRELRASRPSNLAAVAFDLGYSDQAHLNRDFREFAGTSPTAFLAEQLESGATAA